ncbi:MAG: KOW motif-containing protein [Parabacteroides merdae]
MSKLHIKKGDIVFVNAGEDKGKTGRVLEVLVKDNRAIVEGINMVSKSIPSLMQRILKEVLKRRKLLFIFLT